MQSRAYTREKGYEKLCIRKKKRVKYTAQRREKYESTRILPSFCASFFHRARLCFGFPDAFLKIRFSLQTPALARTLLNKSRHRGFLSCNNKQTRNPFDKNVFFLPGN